MPDLRRAARSRNPTRRREAVRALGCIGGPDVVDALEAAARDPDPWVRQVAVGALRVLAPAQSTDLLIDLLTEHHSGGFNVIDERIARDATAGLVAIGSGAVPPLVRSMADASEPARDHIAALLGEIGDPAAATPLIETLDRQYRHDPAPSVNHLSAAVALVRIGRPAVGALIKALEAASSPDHARADIAGVLGEIADPRAVESLIRIGAGTTLAGSDRLFLEALGKIADPAAADFLVAAVHDAARSWETRIRAATALGRIGQTSAVTEMLRLLESLIEHFTTQAAGSLLPQALVLTEFLSVLARLSTPARARPLMHML
ncbi:MAG: HEAT repeat domain-containing protein [Acidobacteriota bacterium]|nr:HEAT repeat domain-containing protein [Acidobacteriota bacterium]